jgi:hypothetical protein
MHEQNEAMKGRWSGIDFNIIYFERVRSLSMYIVRNLFNEKKDDIRL